MLMLPCPLPGRRAGAGFLSWFVPPALAGQVAREAAAERDAALAAACTAWDHGDPVATASTLKAALIQAGELRYC